MSMLFKRIKDWATSITAFRTGDYIAVDGTSGTAKMTKDNLLARTAENALGSIHSLSDTATEADLVAGNYFAIDGSAETKKFPSEILPGTKPQAKYDFALTDENGNVILKLADGHIETKKFDSRTYDKESIESALKCDFAISDDNGNVVLKIENGYVKTKNFDSSKRFTDTLKNDFTISDENGNILLKITGGNIVTSKFESELATNAAVQSNFSIAFTPTSFPDFPNAPIYYRIPAITFTSKKTVLVACDARIGWISDHSSISLVIARSEDGGVTFRNQSVMWSNETNFRYTNPMFIVNGDDIWLMAFKSDKNHEWEETNQIGVGTYTPVFAKSSDDGVTWTKGNFNDLLTDTSFYTSDVVCMFNGCGHGIVTSGGVLVMPAQCKMATGNTAQGEGGMYTIQSCIVYSEDDGETWTRSSLVPSYTSECQCVEKDGYIYINCRGYRGLRKIYRTNDLGATWEAVKTDLVEPTACEASWMYVPNGGRAPSLYHRYVFVNPNDRDDRRNLTVKTSGDLTNWTERCVLFKPIGQGYSDIACWDDGTILVVYEDNACRSLRVANVSGYIF